MPEQKPTQLDALASQLLATRGNIEVLAIQARALSDQIDAALRVLAELQNQYEGVVDTTERPGPAVFGDNR